MLYQQISTKSVSPNNKTKSTVPCTMATRHTAKANITNSQGEGKSFGSTPRCHERAKCIAGGKPVIRGDAVFSIIRLIWWCFSFCKIYTFVQAGVVRILKRKMHCTLTEFCLSIDLTETLNISILFTAVVVYESEDLSRYHNTTKNNKTFV